MMMMMCRKVCQLGSDTRHASIRAPSPSKRKKNTKSESLSFQTTLQI